MCNATCAGAALMTWRASLQRPRCDNLLSSPSVMPRSISTAHAASRARDRDAEPRGRSGRLRGAVAEAPSTPSPPASRLRHRTSSTENLVNAARLVRSESQKQLLQHAQLLATGACTRGPEVPSAPAPDRWASAALLGGILPPGVTQATIHGKWSSPPWWRQAACCTRCVSGLFCAAWGLGWEQLSPATRPRSRAWRPPTSHTAGTASARCSCWSRCAACLPTGARAGLPVRFHACALCPRLTPPPPPGQLGAHKQVPVLLGPPHGDGVHLPEVR